MKSLFLMPLLLLSYLMAGQVHPSPQEYQPVLGVGDELQIGSKSLRFKSVISDSRCPSSVTCVWQGEAEVLFELYDNGIKLGETSFSTSLTLDGEQLAQLFPEEPFYLTNLSLAPYPEKPGEISSQAYLVRLQVMEFPADAFRIKSDQHS